MTMYARGRVSWKFLFVAVLSAVMALTSVPAGVGQLAEADASSSGYRFKRAELCLMRKINRVRASNGRQQLNADKQLAYVARRHAQSMANSGGVWHDTDVGSKVTRWRRLGQNTGRGSSCTSLARSFMRSTKHRDNILGHYRFMGIGVQSSGSYLYVQELFESRRDPGNIYHYP